MEEFSNYSVFLTPTGRRLERGQGPSVLAGTTWPRPSCTGRNRTRSNTSQNLQNIQNVSLTFIFTFMYKIYKLYIVCIYICIKLSTIEGIHKEEEKKLSNKKNVIF